MPVTAHRGWDAMRVGVGLTGLLTWVPRFRYLREAYSSEGIVVAGGSLSLAGEWVPALWQAVLLAVLLIGAYSAIALRPGRIAPIVAFATTLIFVTLEGLNFKAYDRLTLFNLAALAIHGGDGRRADHGYARIALLLVYCGLYASTGLAKAMFEATWWTGGALGSHLVDGEFGLLPFGIWAAQHPWLVKPMGWVTVGFETGFAAAVWFRWPRAVALVLGAAMHLGILATMHVGTFTFVALSAYPVLASADQWAWLSARLRRYRGLLIAAGSTGVLVSLAPLAVSMIVGPRPGRPWTPPDLPLHDALEAALTTLGEEGDAALVTAWGGWTRTVPGTGETVHILAPAGEDGVNARTGLAALLAIGDRLSTARLEGSEGPTVELIAWRIGDPFQRTDRTLALVGLGHREPQGGGQGWAGRSAWVLPHRGDFLAVVGDRQSAESVRAGATLPLLWLPSPAPLAGWDIPAPPGVPVLTDTGPRRWPYGGKRDTIDKIDMDFLARAVLAVEAWIAAG